MGSCRITKSQYTSVNQHFIHVGAWPSPTQISVHCVGARQGVVNPRYVLVIRLETLYMQVYSICPWP